MRRPIQMQPLGNMAVCKAERVSSSTCKRPQLSQSGTSGGHSDDYSIGAETTVGGAERHVVEMMNSGDITYDQACTTLDELWK
jgi:hypothetical protein